MGKVKYIKTSNDEIIVFPELLQHKEFKHFNPVSAGFINFSSQKKEYNGRHYEEVECVCYGDSVSLGIKSDEERDTALARKQILGYGHF